MRQVFLGSAVVLLVVICIAIGWYWGHQQSSYDPYKELNRYGVSRHEFLVKSAQISVVMANRALEALRHKNIQEAIEDSRIAINIFPLDAKPYILLTKLYLMTGQEEKMYDTLTLAGQSYPNFNSIISVIDDDDLDKLPLNEPRDNVYLANFPEDKKMALSFMFDDGEADVYKALPAFEKYGYRATIPVVAGFTFDSTKDHFWGSWAQWRDAANRGFEISNHSMFHIDSKKLHGNDFDISIDLAKETIEKNIGRRVMTYVFPHDSYTPEAVDRALRVHKAIRTVEFLRPFYERTVDVVIGGPFVSIESAERLVDIGAKRHLWLIAKCHGVTDKRSMRSFKSITPSFLAQYLAYIHSKDNEVWVDTFYNVFKYMSWRAKTRIETISSTSGSMDFILRHDVQADAPSKPLTVVIETHANVASARTAGGRALKTWACDEEKICVDVDAYNEKIHVDLNAPNQ